LLTFADDAILIVELDGWCEAFTVAGQVSADTQKL
jgi:hypothetical protein